jgi:2-phospho-L-lactate/phosphoenolpyruvate guanylyltransferase
MPFFASLVGEDRGGADALYPDMRRTASHTNPVNPTCLYDLGVDASPSRSQRVVAIIPIGRLEGAKSRLGGTLDAEERRDLVEAMASRTIRAALAAPGIDEVLVISPDPDVRNRAAALGARTLRQRTNGLNAGLAEARADVMAAGAHAVAIVPIDLPLISPDTIAQLIAPLNAVADRPLVILAPDREGKGTNGLVLSPPDAIEFGFGGESLARHRQRAAAAGARYIELAGPLGLDLDTPDDLLLAEELTSEPVDAR